MSMLLGILMLRSCEKTDSIQLKYRDVQLVELSERTVILLKGLEDV